MCFTLVGTLHLCKWIRKGKDLSHIEKFKWFMYINGWAQIAKSMLHLFLSSDLSYIILLTKLWFGLSSILHWIIVPNQKSFKAWHVFRGSQLHNLGSWDWQTCLSESDSRNKGWIIFKNKNHGDPSNKIFLILWIACGELDILDLLVWIKSHHYLCDMWCKTLLILTYLKHAFSILWYFDLVNSCATWCSHFWSIRLIFRFIYILIEVWHK
jgi:hypothetical protein